MRHSRMFLCLAALLLAAPARAGELDRYLPADTESVVSFNFRQMLNAPLIKNSIEQIRNAINSQDEVVAILKDMGLDPLKDIDSLTMAGPASGEQDKGLIILRGRFNETKIRARAAKEAEDNKDSIKVQKIKDGDGKEHTVYEFNVPGAPLPVYAGVANKTTILAAPSKDYLIDALRVKDDTKVNLKNKEFQELLGKVDDQMTMTFVTLGEALTKGPLENLPVKDTLAKIHTVAGGVTLTDGIKMEFVLGCKKADDARELKTTISEGLNSGLILLGLAAMQEPKLNGLIEVVKSIKTTSKDRSVTIKGQISGEELKKLTGDQ